MSSRRALISRVALLSGAAAFAPYRSTAATRALPVRAEVLVKNATVISMDPAIGDLRNADIHVVNGAISRVGPGLIAPSAHVIDATSMIALPGLIDTHWHQWTTLARNLSGDGTKLGFFGYSRALGAAFTAEDNARGVRLALAEAVNVGLTTVHNFAHNLLTPAHADAEITAMRESGVRGRFSYGYSRNASSETTLPLQEVERVRKQYFSDPSEHLLQLGIASRGPDYNTIATCREEWAFARKLDLPICTHIGIDPKITTGIKVLDEAGLLGADVQLVHMTHHDPGDYERIHRTRTNVALCPFTEGRTGFGFAAVTELLETGSPIGLGVDNCSLCGNADFFQMMRGLQNQENGRRQSESALPARRVIEMATINGARSLGLADITGSLTPGKRADLILVRTDALNMTPVTDPIQMVVQSAHFSNVDTVLIDGRIVKRQGVLVYVDVPALMREAQLAINRIRSVVEQA